MKVTAFKALLMVTVFCVMMTISGCEPESPTDTKKQRLYSAENMALKKQIAKMEKEHARQLTARQEIIDKCEKERDALQQQIDKETIKLFEESVMMELFEQINKLTQENSQLQAEIEKLKR